ncbi:MAG TPA: phosphoribosyltransferase family protein [Candidatus Aminicenantes bacterium]|nr:phosphoribosyltransferase family protein [Candidatus Aminicenantes bacterium]
MAEKLFVGSQQLLEDSVRLGLQIIKSGFRPDFIVGIWRGGTPVGIAVQELMEFYKFKTDHIAIRTSAYEGIERMGRAVRVHGLNYIVRKANADDSLLIVDDIYDTGLSINAVLETMKEKMRRNLPSEIKIATVYYKPANNKTNRTPDFFVHETDRWVVFPHELKDLSDEEMKKGKPELYRIIQEAKIP